MWTRCWIPSRISDFASTSFITVSCLIRAASKYCHLTEILWFHVKCKTIWRQVSRLSYKLMPHDGKSRTLFVITNALECEIFSSRNLRQTYWMNVFIFKCNAINHINKVFHIILFFRCPLFALLIVLINSNEILVYVTVLIEPGHLSVGFARYPCHIVSRCAVTRGLSEIHIRWENFRGRYHVIFW